MLIRPAPFPEELDRGYLGRVMRINGIAKKKDIVALMSAWAGSAEKSRRELSSLELLSLVAGMALPSFVTRHTTLPLRRGVTSYQPDLPHGCESNRSMLWTSGMRMARTGAYFCAECTQEDLDFHGQSYWRREHQIPGLLWCQKHSTPLRYVDDEAAFLSSPAMLLRNCQAVDADWAKEVSGNETIQRYLQICASLMESKSPLDVRSVRCVLKGKASSFGFKTWGGAVKAPLLSDEVINRCGHTWLAMVLPALADKPPGMLLNQLDGVLYLSTAASSVNAYALACAVLFNSPDEAINELSNPASDMQPRRRRRKIDISQEDLINAYVQARGSHTQVASRLEFAFPTVATRLKKIGLPHLAQSSGKNALMAAEAFFLERRSLAESAALSGISIEVMEELVRASGAVLLAALQEMQRPTSGRGSGVKRPLQLTPEEAISAKGQKAFSYSQSRQAIQMDVIEDQKVLQ